MDTSDSSLDYSYPLIIQFSLFSQSISIQDNYDKACFDYSKFPLDTKAESTESYEQKQMVSMTHNSLTFISDEPGRFRAKFLNLKGQISDDKIY